MTALVPLRTCAVAPALPERAPQPAAPVVASAASRAAVGEAIVLAAALEAPLVFVYVRRGPAWFLGEPVYQRGLTKQMNDARRVLDHALHLAWSAEVEAEGEIVEGSPRRRILEFARARGAQLVVVGSRRGRFGRVACAIVRASDGSGRRPRSASEAIGARRSPGRASGLFVGGRVSSPKRPCTRRARERTPVSSPTRIGNWGAKANVALTLAPIAALLITAGLLTAFLIDPPVLGWLGFAIASAVVLGLAAAATLLVPRMRVSVPRPAVATDQHRRLLVIADAHCSELALCEAVNARAGGAGAVHVVVPVRVSRLHFLANDEAEERRKAGQTMLNTVGLLRRRGIPATGAVGSDKPLQSMVDALARFPATHVLLALPPDDESYWLERDLLAKARSLTDRPVAQATVAVSQPVVSLARERAPAAVDERVAGPQADGAESRVADLRRPPTRGPNR